MDEMVVLCVDNEKNVLRSLRRVFHGAPYAVETTQSPAEALELLARRDFDIMVCDYHLREMTGAEFFRSARRLRPDTVKIILSGYAETAAIIEAVNESEIYKFIPKPWKDQDLLAAVSGAALRRKQCIRSTGIAGDLVEKCRTIERKNSLLRKTLAVALHDIELQQDTIRSIEQFISEQYPGAAGTARESIITELSRYAQQARARDEKFRASGGNLLAGLLL